MTTETVKVEQPEPIKCKCEMSGDFWLIVIILLFIAVTK